MKMTSEIANKWYNDIMPKLKIAKIYVPEFKVEDMEERVYGTCLWEHDMYDVFRKEVIFNAKYEFSERVWKLIFVHELAHVLSCQAFKFDKKNNGHGKWWRFFADIIERNTGIPVFETPKEMGIA